MKKLLSLVLSFALVCTLISGCGPKGGGGNSSNQPLDAAETTFGLTPLPERTTLTIGFSPALPTPCPGILLIEWDFLMN